MSKLQELTRYLADCEYKGFRFSCLPMHGEQEVLRVEVSGREEIPIFITFTETQILCISYLFTRQEIYQDKEAILNRCLLEMNVPMPLSAFALIDDYYTIFGALDCESKDESVTQELITLAGNSREILQALDEFIK